MDELAGGGGGGGQGMAAPPRPQQGPGGNLSLPPGASGAPGGGGPAAAEAAGPPAGPELSRPQQYTIPGILHYIQHEWARFEMERAHWEVERAELQVPRPAGLPAGARAWAGGWGPRRGSAPRGAEGDPLERLGLASGAGAPLPRSRSGRLPSHGRRAAGILGAAILAFSMASAGLPTGARGLGPAPPSEGLAWAGWALSLRSFVLLAVRTRGEGLG